MVQDLIERGLHGRQGGQLFDQAVAELDGLARLNGLAVPHDGAGLEAAALVLVKLVKLCWKTFGEVFKYILFRSNI